MTDAITFHGISIEWDSELPEMDWYFCWPVVAVQSPRSKGWILE